MPEPTSKMIAKEKLPKIGMDAYHFMLVGKSHRKSDKGPIKLKIPLMAAKILTAARMAAVLKKIVTIKTMRCTISHWVRIFQTRPC